MKIPADFDAEIWSVVAEIPAGRVATYGQLARLIGMGRPLLHMHLQRLEAAGLVVGTLEVGEDGKSMKYYDVTPFLYELTPHVVAQAAATLTETTGPGRAADRGATEEAE